MKVISKYIFNADKKKMECEQCREQQTVYVYMYISKKIDVDQGC